MFVLHVFSLLIFIFSLFSLTSNNPGKELKQIIMFVSLKFLSSVGVEIAF